MIDLTLPGKSLDAQFDALWLRFNRLANTGDSLNSWVMRWRRWLTPINVSFIAPINDEAVLRYLATMQEALAPHMDYAPQPVDKLHVTLYQVGYLRTGLALPGTWTRSALDKIVSLARQNLTLLEPFDILVGPINAFPNVPIVEVHDEGKIRLLRAGVSQATPRLSRPLPSFPLIPHVTLGYFGHRPAAPIREAMEPLRRRPTMPLHIDQVELTLYYRNPGPYDPSQALRHSTEEVLATLKVGM